ncbi:MAG: alpha/beta fold hydrolase [Bacteroidota bacterium]
MTHTHRFQHHQLRSYEEGEGEPLIFLHGWPTNAQLWRDQVSAFKDSHRVITLDWLGFGQSDKPTDHLYTFTGQKEMLDLVLKDHLSEGEQVTLVLHDIGGPPAILWASENPTRIRRLILLNTVLYTLKTKLDAASEILFTLPILKHILASPFGLRQIMQANTQSRSPAVRQRIKEILEPYRALPTDYKFRTIMQPMEHGRKNELETLSQAFKDLSVEKHLIIGHRDPLCYAHIQKLSSENSEVPAHHLPLAGHYLPLDHPQELNQVLRGILEG